MFPEQPSEVGLYQSALPFTIQQILGAFFKSPFDNPTMTIWKWRLRNDHRAIILEESPTDLNQIKVS